MWLYFGCFDMAGRQAKILTAADVQDLLVFASCTRSPVRKRVIVLLSAKAGLRASEIANLSWSMVLDGNGRINPVIELNDVGKAVDDTRRGRADPGTPEQTCRPSRGADQPSPAALRRLSM
jgi:integrase